MQHAFDAASIPISILLLSLLAWLLHDIITDFFARRRFAKLRALRNSWLQNLGHATSAAPTRRANSRYKGFEAPR